MNGETADWTADGGEVATLAAKSPVARGAAAPSLPIPELPRPLTSLVGRADEAAAVRAMLVRSDRPGGTRLLTLTGPGGIGKTRLALEVAAAMAAEFPDGVVWVPLAPVARASLVVPAIAQVLGVREAGDQALLVGVKAALRGERVLLVLDNFEHVLEAAPDVTELLAACPLVTALVTSRALLRVSGEHAFAVPPLTLAEADDAPAAAHLRQAAAVRLFVERAQAVAPSFALTEGNGPAAAAICRRLDGLPLAIELAAARANLLPPMTLLARLDRRLPFLTGGARDLPERQRSLRAAIAWSYDLLTIEEQTVFRRLGVFAGGAPLDAAVAVCGGGRGDRGTGGQVPLSPIVLDALAVLVDRSLVVAAEEPAGQARVVMLETIREYALEQLQASGEEEKARQAHAEYYRELAGRLNIWKAPSDQAGALALLEVEHANLRGALAWLWERGPAEAVAFCRLCADAFAFWWARGHIREGLEWLDRALTLTVPAEERSSILLGATYLRMTRGEWAPAEALAREAVETASAVGSHWNHAWALWVLGWHIDAVGDLAASVRYYEEALVVARKESVPFPFQVGILLQSLAFAAFRDGDLDRAEALAREALAVLAPSGERYGAGYALRVLGWTRYGKGDPVEALDAWRRAFRAAREVDDPQQMAESMAALGRAALAAGQAVPAVRWLGAAGVQQERSGRGVLEYQDLFEQTIGLARARLGPERFDAAWREGSGLAPGDVWAEVENAALGEGEPAAVSQPSASPMTPREQEILALLVAGKTDREIAEALFVSVRTVEGHVARILGKLGVRTRTAAVTAAMAAGLVSQT